jgi:hypothetical protein
MYTVVITNANWISTLVITFTPGGAPPNSSWLFGGTSPVTYQAATLNQAICMGVDAALGLPSSKKGSSTSPPG